MGELRKENKHEVMANEDLINTLDKLATEANKSVDQYIKNSSQLQEMMAMMLKVLNNENEIMSLEHKDLLKLFDMTAKMQMQPLENFTKLFAQMNQFQEKLNINKELDTLRDITKEVQKARDEAEVIEEEEINSTNILQSLIKDADINSTNIRLIKDADVE